MIDSCLLGEEQMFFGVVLLWEWGSWFHDSDTLMFACPCLSGVLSITESTLARLG